MADLPQKTSDPVLVQFREALEEIYGDRIDRVVLFGSRARGDARPDSDYDIAVFLGVRQLIIVPDWETDSVFKTESVWISWTDISCPWP